MKYIEFVWRLAMTPVYYTFLGAASLVVLVALGPKEFRDFWRKNK